MPRKNPMPLRTLYKKREKRNVVGVLCVFEVDPAKASEESLDQLREARKNEDAKAIAKWIVDNGKGLVFDDGISTYRKTYRDVTDKEDTYGGISVWAWKVLFITMLIVMILGTFSQAWLAGVALAEHDWVQFCFSSLMVVWDAWITHRLRLLMKRFWYRRESL